MSYPVLGILGGGQLGSMLASSANKLNIKTIIYSDDKNALNCLGRLSISSKSVMFLLIIQ